MKDSDLYVLNLEVFCECRCRAEEQASSSHFSFRRSSRPLGGVKVSCWLYLGTKHPRTNNLRANSTLCAPPRGVAFSQETAETSYQCLSCFFTTPLWLVFSPPALSRAFRVGQDSPRALSVHYLAPAASCAGHAYLLSCFIPSFHLPFFTMLATLWIASALLSAAQAAPVHLVRHTVNDLTRRNSISSKGRTVEMNGTHYYVPGKPAVCVILFRTEISLSCELRAPFPWIMHHLTGTIPSCFLWR